MNRLLQFAAVVAGPFLLAQVSAIATGVDAVSRVGFPIVSALAVGAWTVYQDKTFRAERDKDRAAHLDALGKLSDNIGGLREILVRKGMA